METVVIIDLGSYASQEIARLVRSCRVYSEIVPGSASAAEIKKKNPIGIIVVNPAPVEDLQALHLDAEILDLGFPSIFNSHKNSTPRKLCKKFRAF